MRSFEDNLVEYARLAVRAGVNLQPGQDLLLQGDVSQAPLLRLIAEQAYKAGARHVQTVFSDEKLSRIRYDFGSQQTLEYAPATIVFGRRPRAGSRRRRELTIRAGQAACG